MAYSVTQQPPWYTPQKMCAHVHQEAYRIVNSITGNSQELETVQMPMKIGWINKSQYIDAMEYLTAKQTKANKKLQLHTVTT